MTSVIFRFFSVIFLSYYLSYYISLDMDSKFTLASLAGGLIIGGGIAAIKNLKSSKKRQHHHKLKQFPPVWSLIGDVGGTNIRLELVKIQPPHEQPLQKLKAQSLKVKDHESFAEAIRYFLRDVPEQKYPTEAIIAIAGPVSNNRVQVSNVAKWGQLVGDDLAKQLKIHSFKFLNDFEAISYGLLLLNDENIVQLNGKKLKKSLYRGVLGPGTGLGCSLLFQAPFRNRTRIYVVPSEGGHTDLINSSEQLAQYYQFLKKRTGKSYICRQRSFCGPAIPDMFRFFADKYPDKEDSNLDPTSQEIINKYKATKENKQSLYALTVDLFLSLYQDAIGNFISDQMCLGGLYLVGNLTNALIEQIIQRDLIKRYVERHPQMTKILQDVPIVFSKIIDLGLMGAFVVARRIASDEHYEDVQHDR